MTARSRSILFAALLGASSVLLVACGSDDDDTVQPTPDASIDAAHPADAGAADAAGDSRDASDAADGDGTTPCGDPSAPGASCLAGDPCTCSDVLSQHATCVGTAWTCTAGYTRADLCLGFPPAFPHDQCEAYLDGGPFPGITPDAGDAGDASDGATR